MKILVLRTGALGDTILLSPVLQNLRAGFPDRRVHVLGHPERIPLLLGPPNADRVFSSEDPRWLDLHRVPPPEPGTGRWISEYDLIISYSARTGDRVEENLRRLAGERLVEHPALPSPGFDRHYVDFLLEPLADLGLPVRPFLPAVSRPGKRSANPGGSAGRVIIHPGAGSRRKRWPVSGFLSLRRELERAIGGETVFLLGPAEMDLANPIKAERGKILFELDLPGLVTVLESCTAFVGNDSGVTHLAACLGLPTFAVFTATDPVVWAPKGARVEVVDAREPISFREVAARALAFLGFQRGTEIRSEPGSPRSGDG